jgi:hypothetical protein
MASAWSIEHSCGSDFISQYRVAVIAMHLAGSSRW